MPREDLLLWVIAAAIMIGGGFVGLMARWLLAGRVARLVRRSAGRLDDELLASVSPHVPLWFLVLGAVLAVRYAGVDAGVIARADRVALAVVLFSVTLAASHFLARVIALRSEQHPGGVPGTTLIQNAVRISVIALGALVVLGNLGIAIAPLLTALGVGSLAVALALQPTLSNLFAGFHVTLAKHIRVGDYIELEGGQKGFVVDIGWRSTQIRELPNNIIVVPNARLAEVIVRNYSLPEGEQAALVNVGVSYGSDLAYVERVTLETAREVLRETPGAVGEFDPFIRFNSFGDSSVNFTVILRVREFVDRFPVTHEFIKRLHRRYAEVGIEIPFPQRVVHMAGKKEDQP